MTWTWISGLKARDAIPSMSPDCPQVYSMNDPNLAFMTKDVLLPLQPGCAEVPRSFTSTA